MPVTSFDHIALPIENTTEMLEFYQRLGFEVSELDSFIHAVQFGNNKIHFHFPELWKSEEFDLRGPNALPGSGDFCFVWDGNLHDVLILLESSGIEIIAGPVPRTGARNNGSEIGSSIYFRDPDDNLLEFILCEE